MNHHYTLLRGEEYPPGSVEILVTLSIVYIQGQDIIICSKTECTTVGVHPQHVACILATIVYNCF